MLKNIFFFKSSSELELELEAVIFFTAPAKKGRLRLHNTAQRTTGDGQLALHANRAEGARADLHLPGAAAGQPAGRPDGRHGGGRATAVRQPEVQRQVREAQPHRERLRRGRNFYTILTVKGKGSSTELKGRSRVGPTELSTAKSSLMGSRCNLFNIKN